MHNLLSFEILNENLEIFKLSTNILIIKKYGAHAHAGFFNGTIFQRINTQVYDTKSRLHNSPGNF